MKKFIKRLILFLTPVFFIIFLAEDMLRKIPNDYSYKNYYLTNNSKEIEVLVLGNSHAYRGIIPENIDLKTFNAAYISQSLDLDFLIFNKFKQKMTNLKFIIVNISYHSLFSSLKFSKEKWRLKNYNIYYGLNITTNPKNYFEVLGNTYSINKKRFVQYYIENKSLINCSRYGDGCLDESRELENDAIKAVKRHTRKPLIVNNNYIMELQKIIQYANDNNIKIVFITTPVYRSYLERINHKQLNLKNNIIDSLINENKNLFKIDLFSSSEFKKNDFLNADHLNKNGAIKLSKKINNYLKKLSY